VLRLSDDQVEAALFAVGDLVARRRLANRPVPAEVVALHRVLAVASDCGTEIGSGPEELGDDLIDADQAAEILGCTGRWVRSRRIRADLDGQKVGGAWVFRRQAVVEYARARESGDGADGVA
jgi:hypothetical protein